MSIFISQNPAVAPGSRRIAIASLLQQGAGTGPQYLVLAGLDRHHPPAGRETHHGTLHGNGNTYDIVTPGSDSFGFGLVFTYTTSGYYNDSYGYLDEMVFTPSRGSFRSEYLALYGFGTRGVANGAVLAQLEADVSCPLFDAGVFGIPEIYRDAVHLGTLDLDTWTVFCDAGADADRMQGLAANTPRLILSAGGAGSSWPAMGRSSDKAGGLEYYQVA